MMPEPYIYNAQYFSILRIPIRMPISGMKNNLIAAEDPSEKYWEYVPTGLYFHHLGKYEYILKAADDGKSKLKIYVGKE